MSQHTVVQVPAFDSLPLYTRVWLPDDDPAAVLVIAHGIAEHGARYREFAEAMNTVDVAVYVPDHRGHGLTARTPEELGVFSDHDGWAKAVNDLGIVVQYAATAHPGLPLFLMGHSMGSILARSYAIDHSSDLAGLILSGTFTDQRIAGAIGLALARGIARLRGAGYRSQLLRQLSFAPYNRRFRPNRTDFDWLSRDEEQVDRYIADPLCGFVPSVSMYADLLGGARRASVPGAVAQMRPDLPVLIASGTADPMAVDIDRVYELFKGAGIFRTTLQLYPEARHEILNEINRSEVMEDLIGWLLAYLS